MLARGEYSVEPCRFICLDQFRVGDYPEEPNALARPGGDCSKAAQHKDDVVVVASRRIGPASAHHLGQLAAPAEGRHEVAREPGVAPLFPRSTARGCDDDGPLKRTAAAKPGRALHGVTSDFGAGTPRRKPSPQAPCIVA